MIIHLFNSISKPYNFLKAFDSVLDTEANKFYICGNFEQINRTSPSLFAFKDATFLDYSAFPYNKALKKSFVNALKNASRIFIYGLVTLPKEILSLISNNKTLINQSTWIVHDFDLRHACKINQEKLPPYKIKRNHKKLLSLSHKIPLVICTQYYQMKTIGIQFNRKNNIIYIPKPIDIVHSFYLHNIKNNSVPANEDDLTKFLISYNPLISTTDFLEQLEKFSNQIRIVLSIDRSFLEKSSSYKINVNQVCEHLICIKSKFSSDTFLCNGIDTNYIDLLNEVDVAIFNMSGLKKFYHVLYLIYLDKLVLLKDGSQVYKILKQMQFDIKTLEQVETVIKDKNFIETKPKSSAQTLWLKCHLNFQQNADLWKNLFISIEGIKNLEDFTTIYPNYLDNYIGEKVK